MIMKEDYRKHSVDEYTMYYKIVGNEKIICITHDEEVNTWEVEEMKWSEAIHNNLTSMSSIEECDFYRAVVEVISMALK